jgi:uncharacterized protein (TIGR02001 family)
MKSLFRAILVCFAAAFLSLAARADGTLSTASFVSQYMFRGVRLGGPSLQPSVNFESGNFDWGIWANVPIADKVQGQSAPEIDPYASYAFIINSAVNITPGVTVYYYPKAPLDQGFFRTTYEPNIALNYTIKYGIKFTPKLYYDMTLKSTTYELSVACATPLKSLGTELDWTASAGTFMDKNYYNGSSPSEKNWGNYYLVGVSAPFAITKNSTLTAGIAYTKGTQNYFKHGEYPRTMNTAAVGRAVFSVSYTYSY